MSSWGSAPLLMRGRDCSVQHQIQTSGCSYLARIGPLLEAKSYTGTQSSSNSTSQLLP